MFSDFLLGSQSILILQISADIFHIYIYIRYVVDIVLLCECTSLLLWFRVRGDLLSRGTWCGSTRTPWEHWMGATAVGGHLGHATVLCQGTGRAQKA